MNMIPFYCEKNGIELPERVVFARLLENPQIKASREMTKDYSMPSLHKINSQNRLDVSRVKTVLFSSSQIVQPPSHFYPENRLLETKTESTKQITSGFGRTLQQSPKITFSIRSSLPVAFQPNPISPIKTITKEKLPLFPSTKQQQPKIFFGRTTEITPPHQNIVMEKVERKGSKTGE